jgi:hypothetical protein
MVGDVRYDFREKHFHKRGLFLCSNQVVLEHPHYNSEPGRPEWEARLLAYNKKCDAEAGGEPDATANMNTTIESVTERAATRTWYDAKTDLVMVKVFTALPEKFASFLRYEMNKVAHANADAAAAGTSTKKKQEEATATTTTATTGGADADNNDNGES